MIKKPSSQSLTGDLRSRAEKLLAVKGGELKIPPLTDVLKLVQELQVHQIALEMQTEELRQARETIAEARTRYADLYDSAPVGYFTLNPKGKIMAVNLTGARFLGVDRSRLVHQPFSLYVAPESRQACRAHFLKVFATGVRQTCEAKIRPPEGPPFFVALESVALPGEDGPERHCRTTISDIRARRQAEEALRQSEKLFRCLFENMLNGFAYCKMLFADNQPQDFIYLEVNNAFAVLTGLKNVVGKKASEVIPGLRDSDPELFKIYGRVALTGKPEKFETYVEALKMWFSISVYSPAKEYFVAVFDVITERKQAEAALRESEGRFRAIFEQAAVGVALTETATGRFLKINQRFADIVGLAPEEMTVTTFMAITHPDDLPADLDNMEKLRKGLIRQFSLEKRYRRKDGSLVWVNLTVSPLWEAGEAPNYHIAVVEDITNRKIAEAEVKQGLDKLHRTLLGTVAALANTVATKDPYTAGHQRRVAQLACAMARELGWPEARVEGMQVQGLLHDLGKIAVPAEILSRPGRISSTEFDLIKAHPQVGYDILKDIDFPWPVARTVLQHHERLNGSGYPAGLTGAAISPEARILAVADVVEAMASHRPYRATLGIEIALEEITRHKGELFDPEAVDVCVKLFTEQGFAFDAPGQP
jgi:PAS domain S-box-containing protein/putative nucleotidyltransferase with HDIG domain